MNQDTIIALSTPTGSGALAVLRISGGKSIAITQKIWKGKPLDQQSTHTLHFGRIVESDQVIDEVVVSLFKGPKSFTGEDVVEISLHNSPYIIRKVQQLFLENGVRLAKAGEFTERAFLNGKIDLAQSEAIADLISSETERAHRAAMNQMRGGFSQELAVLRQQLIDFAALVELELDFGEEDVEFADRSRLTQLMDTIREKIQALLESFKVGNAIKNGIPVVIAGKPNAGKSTLLNSLFQEDKAIVSDIPGTTRDVIEGELVLKGLTFRFVDTAGLRETKDKVEAIGVQKSYEQMQKADLILYLIDVTQEDLDAELKHLREIERLGIPTVAVLNKVDLIEGKLPAQLTAVPNYIPISAKSAKDVKALSEALVEKVQLPDFKQGDTVVTNLRHYESLRSADDSLANASEAVFAGISGDLLAMDIRQALHHLGEITGEISNEEVLGSIFSRFCIGK